MDPTKFQVADISKTSMDPIARIVRTKRKDGIKKGVKVVFSLEEPMKPRQDVTEKIVPENAPEIRKADLRQAMHSFRLWPD